MENQEELAKILAAHGYTYIREIGRGGYTTVVLVHSARYFSDFVAKILVKTKKHPSAETFYDEIETLKCLYHPNVITFYDFFRDGDVSVSILEYCPGGSLHDYVWENGPLPVSALIPVVYGIVSGLAFCAEKGFVHADVKPENCLIDKNGRIRVADFGFAIRAEDGGLVKNRKGSLPYIAPEVLAGQEYDPYKADIWSLGITIFYLATGSLPWIFTVAEKRLLIQEIKKGEFNVRCDPEIKELITMMTNLNPKERPSLDEIKELPIFEHVEGTQIRRFRSLNAKRPQGEEWFQKRSTSHIVQRTPLSSRIQMKHLKTGNGKAARLVVPIPTFGALVH